MYGICPSEPHFTQTNFHTFSPEMQGIIYRHFILNWSHMTIYVRIINNCKLDEPQRKVNKNTTFKLLLSKIQNQLKNKLAMLIINKRYRMFSVWANIPRYVNDSSVKQHYQITL